MTLLSRSRPAPPAQATDLARAALERVIAAAGVGAKGDAFVERTTRVTASVRGGRAQPPAVRSSRGASLRTWNRADQRFASADGEPAEALTACLRQMRESVPPPPFVREVESEGADAPPPFAWIDEALTLLSGLEHNLARSLRGLICELTLELVRRETLVVTDDGGAWGGTWGWVRLHLSVSKDDGPLVAWAGGAPHLKALSQTHPAERIRLALARRVEGVNAEPGRLPRLAPEVAVMFGRGRGALPLHELMHGLEADAVQAGWTPGALGIPSDRVVLSPLLNVWDDPLRPGMRGSYERDDEGCRADRCQLIRRGRIVGRLGDRRGAEKDRRVQPGHGRRSSCHDWPLPRAANLHLAAGPHDRDLVRTERGLLLVIHDVDGGGTDPLSGALILVVSDAEWWDGGHCIGPASGLVLEGDAVEVLASVDRVCADRDVDSGSATCARDGSGVPIGFLAPSFRTRGLREIASGPAAVGGT